MLKLDDLQLDDMFLSETPDIKEISGNEIAIIGMSARLPQAEGLDDFWSNLKESLDCVGEFPAARRKDAGSLLRGIGIDDQSIAFGDGAYLSDVDKFDYRFFQLSPMEASLMNPAQRLFLETVWKTIEDAGYGGKKLKGSKTGVFLGHTSIPFAHSYYDYSRFIAEKDMSLVPMAIPGNLNAMIASRISYLLDLKGPSLVIDTACSSSLVAVHMACQSIRNGECETAIAGGVKINLFPIDSEHKLGIESSSDRARTFDDHADGTGRGEGVAAVLLKPLSHALKDGDQIYAVIKGSSINQDGSSIGITAPNALTQEEVIDEAWHNAGIDPTTIAYIEAHGTGTKLGDPIEITGINRAFSRHTDRKQFCAIGSVKSSIGHLDDAAGIVGMIKAVLALKNKAIPPTLHFTYPNRNIEFEQSAVYVSNSLSDWEYEGFPRRSGVSAFGLSGTNCHVVLEEAPEREAVGAESGKPYLLTLSAKSRSSIEQLVASYDDYVQSEAFSEVSLADMSSTMNTGRGHYNYRIAIVASNREEVRASFRALVQGGLQSYPELHVRFNETMASNEAIHSLSRKAADMVRSALDVNQLDGKLLDTLSELYTDGADIDFESLYFGDAIRKLSLPVYPFERSRCWIELNPRHVSAEQLDSQTQQQVALSGRVNGEYTQTESAVAQIWGQTLGFNDIQVDANYYELGGDSVIASRIVNALNQQFGLQVDVTGLLRNPTVEQLASHLDAMASAEGQGLSDELRIVPVEKRDYYDASLIQKQCYAQEQFSNIGTALNMPLVMEFQSAADAGRIQRTLQALLDRHESLRTSFAFAEGDLVQFVHDNPALTWAERNVTQAEVDEAIHAFIQPFDLGAGPLFRSMLLHVDGQRDVLIVDMHHIVSDGTSYQIFVQEFITLYEGGTLPPLEVQNKDYCTWQKQFMQTERYEKQQAYWKHILFENVPTLQLPQDFKRGDGRGFEGNTLKFELSDETVHRLTRAAQEANVTLNTLLFAAYTLLLQQFSGQQEIIVGTVVSGRNHKQIEGIIGAFLSLLPIKQTIIAEETIRQFLSSCNEAMLGAFENQDYHYTSMIELCNIKLDRSRNPLFDTALIFHNEYDGKVSLEAGGIPFTVRSISHNRSQLDLKLDIYTSQSDALMCHLEYKTDLFKQETVEDFIAKFHSLLSEFSSHADKRIDELQLLSEEEKLQVQQRLEQNVRGIGQSIELAISASFTAEPIDRHVAWWASEFSLPLDLKFAAYNQVFMELLEPSSLLSTNKGANVLLVRFEDWIRYNPSNQDAVLCEELERSYREFTSILVDKQKSVPYFVGVFPIATHLGLSEAVAACLERLSKQWQQLIEELDHVYPLDFTSIADLYQVHAIFDPVKDAEGHIPFTDEFMAAMGATIVRAIHSWKSPSFKVIVLDCDNTLWSGVCGEDGPMGVQVTDSFAALQRFMLQKREKGMLLALSSKNNEADVWEVFEHNPNMLLKKEHFIGWKINWEAKSANLRELAVDLNLGLDSFIFLDDNVMECSEMMMNCPEVLTLNLPREEREISSYLRHVWAFDQLIVTDEDLKRSERYIQEKQRQEVQQEAHSPLDYLRGLELKMSMRAVEPSQIARVSQLTKRTNQFNLSTIRRSEDEIKQLMDTSETACWSIEVADRFGDYGLVGVVIAIRQEQSLFIDTFLLSCRVLGRTVEDAVMTGLAQYCAANGLTTLEAKFYPTNKNEPFLAFIERAGWEKSEETADYAAYRLPVDAIQADAQIIDCYYNAAYPVQDAASSVKQEMLQAVSQIAAASAVAEPDGSAEWTVPTWDVHQINDEALLHAKHLTPIRYHSAYLIMDKQREEQLTSSAATDEYYEAPRTEAEKRIAEVWQNTLGIDRISVYSKFFDIGGTSLSGIQIVSTLSMEFELSLNDFFEYDTIASLAKNVPFKPNYLLELLKEKEELAKIELKANIEEDPAIKAQLDQYEEELSACREMDLTDVVVYKDILLTGATGYLGIHLLHDLLTTTTSNVHMIVRGADAAEAEARLQAKLAFYFSEDLASRYADRIFVYNGDVAEERLGLSEEQYAMLADVIDCIINSAANVTHYGRYQDSHRVNVLGTERLVDLAFAGQRKVLHHISTPLVAFGKIDGVDDVLYTENEHDLGQDDDNIYFLTKLESERVIVAARERGLACSIFRVGNLNYNTETMKFQENIEGSALYSMIKSFINIKMVPSLSGRGLDFSFVNHVTQAILLLFNKKQLQNKTHHLYNSNRINGLQLGEYIQQSGYTDVELRTVGEIFGSYHIKELQEDIMNIVIHGGLMGNLRDTNFHMRADRTNLLLERLGFTWKPVDQTNVQSMLRYAEQVGFL
ncbi:FkbH like protein [Paenibacillus curdlanolyticus YK9]|uniref:FkbH like protein n=1 Tax=Paenibacillus curdlanolyticus YK9 TaxID=717606 RepID=E0I4N0_9BACL|nr:HAD-IIIC family phosphatase [Paenibacillus curdlanolyticus]EFM12561.1 FkbH like protein [Paenibacillus curdlanolyticus YK9]